MRTPEWFGLARAASLATLVVCSGGSIYAADGAGQSPFGLPRLAGLPANANEKAIAAGAYEVLELFSPPAEAAGEHGGTKRQDNVSYVDVSPKATWSQNLRPQRKGANYITFILTASVGTTITLGPVKLGIAESLDDPTYAAIMRADSDSATAGWLPLNHETQMLPYSGALRALLAPCTVKLDSATGRWSIWIVDTLIGEDLAFPSPRSPARAALSVTAGDGGAWVCGVACADENPLFEDANHNDVPDTFEVANLGQILRPGAATDAKAALREAWIETRATRTPSEYTVSVPAPDYLPDWCGLDGVAPVHGMPNAIRYRHSDATNTNLARAMKPKINWVLASLLAAIIAIPTAASVHICNNDPCSIKHVVIFHRITCGSYYQTTFTCDHYLGYGQCVDFTDGPENNGECWHTYSVQSITTIPTCNYVPGLLMLNVDYANAVDNCVNAFPQYSWVDQDPSFEILDKYEVAITNHFANVPTGSPLLGKPEDTMGGNVGGTNVFNPNASITATLQNVGSAGSPRWDIKGWVVSFHNYTTYNSDHFPSGSNLPTKCNQYAEYEHFEAYGQKLDGLWDLIDDRMGELFNVSMTGTKENVEQKVRGAVQREIIDWDKPIRTYNYKLDGRDANGNPTLSPDPSDPKRCSHTNQTGAPAIQKPINFIGFHNGLTVFFGPP